MHNVPSFVKDFREVLTVLIDENVMDDIVNIIIGFLMVSVQQKEIFQLV